MVDSPLQFLLCRLQAKSDANHKVVLTRQCLIELTIPKLGGEELPLNAVHPLSPVDVKFRLLEIHLCLHREVTYGTILLFYVAG